MSEHIPDLNKVRTEKIQAISRLVEEVSNDYINSFYDSLILIWTKKDSVQNLEFTLGKYPPESNEETETVLDELYETLVQSIQPEIPDYVFHRTDEGIRLEKLPMQ